MHHAPCTIHHAPDLLVCFSIVSPRHEVGIATNENKVMTNIPCNSEMITTILFLVSLMLVLQFSALSHAEGAAHEGDVPDERKIVMRTASRPRTQFQFGKLKVKP